MRLSFLSLALLTSALPAVAQVGTYRPAPVASVSPASAPDQCVSHCMGDAGCRGWNFVTVAPGEAVCEMLSGDADPVPNLRATSGAAPGLAPSHHRILRGAPGRTVRIGSPEPRRITRAAPPEAGRPAPVRAMPPIERRPAPQTPRFRHALEAAPRPAWSRPQTQVRTQPPSQAPVATPPRPRPAPVDRPVQAPTPQAVHTPPARPAPTTSPFASKPVAPAQPRPAMPRPTAPSRASSQAAQESLFGSLYDDVAIPAPAAVSENIADADAPVATAVAVPVRPVSVESLKGLAGG